MVKSIFLSHAHIDSDLAVALARRLEQSLGVRVVCTSKPEHRISSAMVTAGLIEHIKACDVVLELVTPRSSGPLPWIAYEMGASHALGKLFIPCAADGIRLSDLPPQACEYHGADIDNADEFDKLLCFLRSELHV